MKSKDLYISLLKSHPYLPDWKDAKDFTDKKWLDLIIKIPELQKVYASLNLEKVYKKSQNRMKFN